MMFYDVSQCFTSLVSCVTIGIADRLMDHNNATGIANPNTAGIVNIAGSHAKLHPEWRLDWTNSVPGGQFIKGHTGSIITNLTLPSSST